MYKHAIPDPMDYVTIHEFAGLCRAYGFSRFPVRRFDTLFLKAIHAIKTLQAHRVFANRGFISNEAYFAKVFGLDLSLVSICEVVYKVLNPLD